MNAFEWKTLLKNEAARLGFPLFGVTSPSPPQYFPKFLNWLDNQFQAEMGYLARQDTILKRSDPSLLMPGCNSIIVLGFPCELEDPRNDQEFHIAGYARSEDYHHLFPRLLLPLQEMIKTHSGGKCTSKTFTDSAPILERELGSRAGLGWIGKNTCLISPEYGSAFLLTEIFTDLILEPDEPFHRDLCGTCQRCVQACPTGCILFGRQVVSGKCIAYLTTEEKGFIPVESRSKIANWLFGCDLCQVICPWNQKRKRKYPSVGDLNDFDSGDLLDILAQASEPDLFPRYARSPLARVQELGILRNAITVMGNSGKSEYISLLEGIALTEGDPVIQEMVSWARNQILAN